MRNRKEEIMGIAQGMFTEQFQKSGKETVLFCKKNAKEMVEPFLEAFYTGIEQAMLLQDRKEKWEIKYIQFSHLFSSLFSGNYLIRMDVLDERFYNDTSGIESYWNAKAVYHLFEEDIQAIRKRVEQSIPRVREYEVDYIRYGYGPFYHSLTKSFLKILLEELMGEVSFLLEERRREKEIYLLFGEYMGQAEVLLTMTR